MMLALLAVLVIGLACGYGMGRFQRTNDPPGLPPSPWTHLGAMEPVPVASTEVYPAFAPVITAEAAPEIPATVPADAGPAEAAFHVQLRYPDGRVVRLAASDDGMEAKDFFLTHPAHGAPSGAEIHLVDQSLGLSRAHRVVA